MVQLKNMLVLLQASSRNFSAIDASPSSLHVLIATGIGFCSRPGI